MQRPTLQNVRIRSTRDAQQVFHGVATHRLPLITRRLDAEERRNIVSGNIYVWEERGANCEPTGLGMERWTDGMGWGPSRVRDEFLFYHQKDSENSDDLLNPVAPWAQMMRRQGSRPAKPFSEGYSVPDADRLVKQTYSVHVALPPDRSKGLVRKWHLTAYFSPSKLHELDTIDSIPGIGDVLVPEGWFRSARIGRHRRDSHPPGFTPPSMLPSPPALDYHNRPAMGPYHPPHGYPSHPPHHHPPGPSGHFPQYHPHLSHAYPSHPPHPSHPHPPHPHPPHPHPPPHMSGPGYPGQMTAPRSHGHDGAHAPKGSRLVPLEVLVRTHAPRREPQDEEQLRKFHY